MSMMSSSISLPALRVRRRDVDDLGVERRHEVGRGEVEVDPERAAADRDHVERGGGGVDDDRPRAGRPERGDRVALVAGRRPGLVRIGQGQAPDAEVLAQPRPVESTAGRDEHEQVVVVAAADDDGPQQGAGRDALQAGGLLGAAGALRADHREWHGQRPSPR